MENALFIFVTISIELHFKVQIMKKKLYNFFINIIRNAVQNMKSVWSFVFTPLMIYGKGLKYTTIFIYFFPFHIWSLNLGSKSFLMCVALNKIFIRFGKVL